MRCRPALLVAALAVGLAAGPVLARPGVPFPACQSPTATLAAPGGWTQIAPPAFTHPVPTSSNFGGSWVQPNKPTVMMAWDQYTIMRSTNGGCSWSAAFSIPLTPNSPTEPYSSGGARDLGAIRQVVSGSTAATAATVYAVIEGLDTNFVTGLYRSSDGGAHWTHLAATGLPPQSFTTLAVTGDAHTLYLAATSPSDAYLKYFWMSTDDGQSWTQRGGPLPYVEQSAAFTVEVDPLNSRNVWVYTDSTIERSRDGGVTFTKVNPFGGPCPAADTTCRLGATDVRIVHTRGTQAQVWIAPSDNQVYLTKHVPGVFLSMDDGKHWAAIQTPDLCPVFAHGLNIATTVLACVNASTKVGSLYNSNADVLVWKPRVRRWSTITPPQYKPSVRFDQFGVAGTATQPYVVGWFVDANNNPVLDRHLAK
jgi:hypothetical protein